VSPKVFFSTVFAAQYRLELQFLANFMHDYATEFENNSGCHKAAG
jgi:hypothetical protein